MPPPGCTVPPQQYNPFAKLEKFGWRKNAEKMLLELAPYSEPIKLPVFFSIVMGSQIVSVSIKGAISSPSMALIFCIMFFLLVLVICSQFCPVLDGALIITNQFSLPAGAWVQSFFAVILMYTVGSLLIFFNLKSWLNSLK